MGFTVGEDHPVTHLKGVPGDSNTSLYIIVLLVHRPDDQGTVGLLRILPAVESHVGVVVIRWKSGEYRIPVGEVEYHHITAPDVAETGQTPVVTLDEVRIGLPAENGVVDKGYGKRSLGQLGAIGQLAYKQVVSCHQSTLHRRGGDTERLEDEDIERNHHNDGKDDGIEPVQPDIALLPFLVRLLPESPFHLAGDEYVENHRKAQQPPVIAEPYHPKEIQDAPDAETEPLVMQKLFHVLIRRITSSQS